MEPTPRAPLTLYTFAMSHYSEKIRWTLDACDIPYREVCLSPAFHIVPALRMGGRGQTTLPIIQGDGHCVQDSPRILTWLQANRGPLVVMPPSLDIAVREVEQRFDAIGKDVARYLYAGSFGVADEHIVKLWTDQANRFQAAVIRASYPLMRWVFRQKLQIMPARVERARQRIAGVLDWLDAQLADGRRFLVGDTLPPPTSPPHRCWRPWPAPRSTRSTGTRLTRRACAWRFRPGRAGAASPGSVRFTTPGGAP